MNQPPLPLSKQQIAQHINQLVTQSADAVLITKHCELRMEERGITRREAWTCLRRGIVGSEPQYNQEYQTWEFKFTEAPPRDAICVVVAAQLDPLTNRIYALTVYEV